MTDDFDKYLRDNPMPTTEKRFERIYGDVDVFCIDHNAKGVSQFIERDDYDKIVECLNALHEEKQRLKQYTKQVLQNHLNSWRGVYNPINESIIVEINVVKSIAEDLGVDYE